MINIFTVNKEKFSLKKMSLRKLIMAYNIPSPPTVTMKPGGHSLLGSGNEIR